MRDDEKMFNLGLTMFMVVVLLIVFLQVCYRTQNSELNHIHNTIETLQQETENAETKFSALSSADFLRSVVMRAKPKSETVSFSKTVHINNIPMVE